MEDLPQVVRLEDRNVARYKGHLYKVALTTGEVVECIANGNDLYELERLTDHIPTEDGHSMRLAYVSSYCLPEIVLRKTANHDRDPRSIRDMGEVIIERSSMYEPDLDGATIEFGSQPYYLAVIQ